ncbi:hypothetical protein PR048_023338 [Dryococelus australis]|uniref:Uncharacterized protein n=1 Tax=Dryococelus australis TaxID=614101 RepID=A0ABQ9GTT2_9NEOP|nr:hypothetical protein PR048_023338 [Dryococelus australis]
MEWKTYNLQETAIHPTKRSHTPDFCQTNPSQLAPHALQSAPHAPQSAPHAPQSGGSALPCTWPRCLVGGAETEHSCGGIGNNVRSLGCTLNHSTCCDQRGRFIKNQYGPIRSLTWPCVPTLHRMWERARALQVSAGPPFYITGTLLPQRGGRSVRDLGHPVGCQLDCGGEEKLTPSPLFTHQTYFMLQS